MEQTRPRRQKQIRDLTGQSMTLTEIFNKWPAFRSLPGSLVHAEFGYVYEETFGKPAPNLAALWDKMSLVIVEDSVSSHLDNCQGKILQAFGLHGHCVSEGYESIAAFMMLPWMFISSTGKHKGKSNCGRLSASAALPFLITFDKESTTLEESVQKIKEKGILQPVILAKNGNGEYGPPTELFLVLDFECILVEGNFTKAVELLFESIWVFYLEYPAEVKVCYHFLENLFGMNRGDFCSLKGKGNRSGQATHKFTRLLSLMESSEYSNDDSDVYYVFVSCGTVVISHSKH